jgi:hypothetical protein
MGRYGGVFYKNASGSKQYLNPDQRKRICLNR